MSNATTVSPAHSASSASTLITNIAALVTNDPSLGWGSPARANSRVGEDLPSD